MTIHKEGFKILGGTLLVSTILVGCGFLLFESPLVWVLTAIACGIVFLLFLQFFRLPNRVNRANENELVAPCDGKVVVIEEVEEPEYFQGKRIQVSIFMSPLNVHANWTPCSGEVKYFKYHPGLFLVAWHPKSSTENERTTVGLYHPLTKHLNTVLEYNEGKSQNQAGAENKARTLSLGAILFF